MDRLYTSSDPSWNWQIPVHHRHAVRHGRYLFVGGQCDLDRHGQVCHAADLARQCDSVVAHVLACVEQLGGRVQDIVKLNVFYVGGDVETEATLLRRIGRRICTVVPPVMSLVAVQRLPYPGMMITMDALAIDNSDGLAPRQAAEVSGHSPWLGNAPYSHGIRCGELLFVAAQSARKAQGTVQYPDDIVSQAQMTIDHIGSVLGAMGADLDDVVKLNTWFVGQGTDEDWRRAARVRSEAFRYPGPAATGVPVARPFPDGALLRQECWAMRGTDGRRLPRSLSWPLGHWDWPIRVSFQQGIKVGCWIFLGGQYACDMAGKAQAPGDMQRQAEITMDFIQAVLAGFGATPDDLVKTTCFYRSDGTPQSLHTNLAARSRRFAPPAHAATSVALETMGLEGLMLEIEGIAIVDSARMQLVQSA